MLSIFTLQTSGTTFAPRKLPFDFAFVHFFYNRTSLKLFYVGIFTIVRFNISINLIIRIIIKGLTELLSFKSNLGLKENEKRELGSLSCLTVNIRRRIPQKAKQIPLDVSSYSKINNSALNRMRHHGRRMFTKETKNRVE